MAACPEGLGIVNGDFSMCEPDEGHSNLVAKTLSEGDLGRTATCWPWSLGLLNVLSRTTREKKSLWTVSCDAIHAFAMLPLMSRWQKEELSDVAHKNNDDLGDACALAGHDGETFRPRENAPVQGWLTNHPVFTSALDRLHQQVTPTDDQFQAPANFKTCVPKAQHEARRTLLRNPPTQNGAKLVVAAIAVRASRNKTLRILKCCDDWEPIAKCFGVHTFQRTDFVTLTQIISTLAKQNIAEREDQSTSHRGHNVRMTWHWQNGYAAVVHGQKDPR